MQSARFHTTCWTEIHTAAGASPDARAALEGFCASYWYPLYAFLRRDGHTADDASDLVQGFFASFLARNDLAAVDRERGRFRSYLLGALRHFVANERAKANARKRGGGMQPASLDTFDAGEAERRYGAEPATLETPERIFERGFAHALLAIALERLEHDETERGRGREFAVLRATLSEPAVEGGYAGLADELGTTEGAVRTAVHRLRKRYRGALVDEVLRHVERPQDVEDELRHLLTVLAGADRG